MSNPIQSPGTADSPILAEAIEVLLSALAGCGIVLVLAFFMSLEAWVVAAAG